MEKDEAKMNDRNYQNDEDFQELLIEAVHSHELRASHALYLYCQRHGIEEFPLVNLKLNDGSRRPAVVECFDAILEGEGAEMAQLLAVVDKERLAGRL